MAICEYCNQEMLEADGCTMTRVKIHGKIYDRIKVGDENDLFSESNRDNGYCHDCGARVGFYHHPYCDSETYPPNLPDLDQFLMEMDETEEYLP